MACHFIVTLFQIREDGFGASGNIPAGWNQMESIATQAKGKKSGAASRLTAAMEYKGRSFCFPPGFPIGRPVSRTGHSMVIGQEPLPEGVVPRTMTPEGDCIRGDFQ